MKKKLLAATLSCTLLLSASAPALAVRTPTAGAYGPLSVTGAVQRSYTFSNHVSLDDLGGIIEKNNLTVRMMREQLASAKAMDWSETYKELYDALDEIKDGKEELEDARDELEDAKDELKKNINGIGAMRDNLSAQIAAATTDSQTALAQVAAALKNSETTEAQIAEAIANSKLKDSDLASLQAKLAATPTVADLQKQMDTINDNLETMDENLDTLDENLDNLMDQIDSVEKQEADYNRTLADTERRIEDTIHQLTAGARTLYLTILTTENQLTSMQDTAAATARTLKEMKLRCSLGQVSSLTVAQVQNGYDQLVGSFPSLETAIDTMTASLQSLLGDLAGGDLILEGTPAVPEGAIAAIDYQTDLAAAKAHSFTLYSAQRAVEDAQRDMADALEDEGRASYQYKMAQHAYEAALLTQSSTITSFTQSFRQLYTALAPAQTALTTAEASLTYQEQVYGVAKLKYDMGKISKNALLDAEDTLTTAQRAVETARLDLFTAWNSYQQGVDWGLVTSAS